MWFVVLPVVLAAGAVVAWVASSFKNDLKNAVVVIVGPRKSGKTTLYRFMTSQTPIQPEDYKPTYDSPSKEIDLSSLSGDAWSDLEWDVREFSIAVKDSPGGSSGRGYWFEAAKEAALLIFVANGHLLVEPSQDGDEYRRLTLSDARQVGSWDRVTKGDLNVLVVLSHVDQVIAPEGSDSTAHLLENVDVRDLRKTLRAHGPMGIAMGNLLNPESAAGVAIHALRMAHQGVKSHG